MRLYARQGRRGEALRQYQVCVSVLQRELRAEPEAETKHLYRELLQQTATRGATPDAAPGPRVLARGAPRRAGTVPARGPADRARGGDGAAAAGVGGRGAGAGAGRGDRRRGGDRQEPGAGRGRRPRRRSRAGACCWAGATRASRSCRSGPGWTPSARGGSSATRRCWAQLNPAWRAELARLLPEVAASRRAAAPTDDRLRLFESVVPPGRAARGDAADRAGLEDLHWADDMSLRLLAFVARRIRAAAVLIVATVREDEPGSGEVLRLAGDELGREPHCQRAARCRR